MVANKKLKVSDESDEVSEESDDNLDDEIDEKLHEAQYELDKINDEVGDKVLEIEQEYNKKRKPLYEKRNEIIKDVPGFWRRAFLRHPVLRELLNNEDEKIFKYLSSLEVEDFDDIKSGYSITLNFNPNPYFEDTKLTKTYTFLKYGQTEITATPINWKEGKGIPIGDYKMKRKKRFLTYDSFFDWFCDNGEDDNEDWDHINEDGDNHPDNEVAELIKDDLWPNAVTHFNNDVPSEVDEDSDDKDDYKDEDEDEW